MIKLVGDINFTDGFFDTGFGVGSSIAKCNNPFKYLNKTEQDIWIGNFECVCSNVSNKKGIYSKQFIISPSLLTHIEHFDIYGVANNHVMQHGPKAYHNLLQNIINNNAQYVGTNDKRSIVFEHVGKKIGLLAFSQRPDNFSDKPLYWSLPEYKEVESEILKLSSCDYIVAYIHWGNEFINYPYIDQKQFAHWMIDCGVDLIIGMHPHVLQGYEIYKNKYIFYSLGNFVFNMPWINTKYSVIVNLDVSNNFKISFEYIKIGDDYFPTIVNQNEVPPKFHFEYLNTLLYKKCVENEIYFRDVFKEAEKYRRNKNINLVKNLYRFNAKDIIYVFLDFLKRRLL